VGLAWYPAPTPAPPGYQVVASELGPDGLACWSSRPEWLAAHADDPRLQFPGEVMARSPVSRYALDRTAPSDRALWTSVGLDGQTREVRLPVPACQAGGGCPPVTWTLRASGPPVWLPFPAFGAPGPVRPVILLVTSAGIDPGG